MSDMEIVLQAIEGISKELTSFKSEVNTRFDNLESDIKGINSRLENVEGSVKGINGRLDNMEGDIKDINGRLENVEKDVKSLKITNETEFSPILKMLLEYQISDSNRLINVENNVEKLTDEIAVNEVINTIK